MKGIYKHYKGSVYKVIGIATHSETSEELALYHLNQTKTWNGGYELAIWARPVKMFDEYVIYNGVKVKRFEKIGDV